GKLRLGERGAVDALQHAQTELHHQRPLGGARAAYRGRDSSRHSRAVENMRDQRAPPEPRKAGAGHGHLPLRFGEELTRAGSARVSQQRTWRKRNLETRFVNGLGQCAILAPSAAPRVGNTDLEKSFFAN